MALFVLQELLQGVIGNRLTELDNSRKTESVIGKG